MPRIRTIKPEFPHSESMGRVSREARLLFIQLWTLADDEGRLRGNSRILASLLYPYDDDAKDLMDSWLSELEREKCIVRYVVDGSTYLQIVNWEEHQKIDRPTKSKLPPFEESSRLLASPREDSRGKVASPREASSLDLDQGRDQGKDQGREQISVERERSTASERERSESIERIFRHWQQVHHHPHAKLDEKRRKVIRRALELGYSEADLCQAISGYRNSPHHMGQNETGTVYDSIELMLRDAKHIDAGLKFYAEPPRSDLSALTRRNVEATADWVPPEMRHATG